PIGGDVLGADLEQIVEAGRDHMRLFDLGQGAHRLVEGFERRLAGVAETHFDESDMGQAQPAGIDDGAISQDIAAVLKPLDANLAGGFGEIYPATQLRNADATIAGKFIEDAEVDLVELASIGLGHRGKSQDWHPKRTIHLPGLTRSGKSPLAFLASSS